MSATPEADGRCTLNGYLNNYSSVVWAHVDAASESNVDSPPPPFVIERLKRGETVVYNPVSDRDRALEQIRLEALPALESWYVPSLQEAARAGVLAAIAPPLRDARAAMLRLKQVTPDVKDGRDRTFLAARDAAFDAFAELDQLRHLVVAERARTGLTDESDPAPNGFTPAVRDAYLSYRAALDAKPDLGSATDAAVFAWIVENYQDRRYRREELKNWARQLREARRLRGESKYTRRTPSGGRSIVKPDGSSSQE